MASRPKAIPTKAAGRKKPSSSFVVTDSPKKKPSSSFVVTDSPKKPLSPAVSTEPPLKSDEDSTIPGEKETPEESSPDDEDPLLITSAELARKSIINKDLEEAEITLNRLNEEDAALSAQEDAALAIALAKEKRAIALANQEKREKRLKEEADEEKEKLERTALLKSKISAIQTSMANRQKVDDAAMQGNTAKRPKMDDKSSKQGDPSSETKKPKSNFLLPITVGSDSSSSVKPATERLPKISVSTGDLNPDPQDSSLRLPPGHILMPVGHHSLASASPSAGHIPTVGHLFVPSLATKADIEGLMTLAATSDYGAAAAAYVAIELYQGLLLQVTSTLNATPSRSSKLRSATVETKAPDSEEVALTKLIMTASCQNLVQRVMFNPKAMLSLNCFLPSNRPHFNWVEEIASGQKKPFLQPFPANLTGRDLLSIFHQFIMLVTVVDAFFGVSLSFLYKVVEDLLASEQPPLVAAKYIEEVRQAVSASEDTSLMWSLQDHILAQVKSTFSATTPTPKQKSVAALDGAKDQGKHDDHRDRDHRDRRRDPGVDDNRRPYGTDDNRRPSGRNGYQRDSQPRYENRPAIPFRVPQQDPSRRYVSCDAFNSANGCSYAAADCKYNHVCCLCGDSNHGIMGRCPTKSKGDVPTVKLLENGGK